MAKNPGSVAGIDLGRYALKAVLMQRKSGSRLVLTHYGVRELAEPVTSPEAIAAEVRALLGAMGGSTKHLALAVSSSDALIRIIEQPETPTEMLRHAVRLNGQSLLNQDVRDFVLDCALIPNATTLDGNKRRYLVGGLPRQTVTHLNQAFEKERAKLSTVQLSPVCTFNAFEYAHSGTFENEAFMLVDIGHLSSTIGVGVKRELILVRVLDYGGSSLVQALIRAGAADRAAALQALDDWDDDITEAARVSLSTLTREISSSIGFFEGRREESIARVFVSGGAAGSRSVLQIMAEELHMPCMAWNPLERCEVNLPDTRKMDLATDIVNLHAACGAAMEFLKES